MGVIGLILVTLCIPVFVLENMSWSSYDSLDYEVKLEANQTACSYLKQFDLKDNTILSVR